MHFYSHLIKIETVIIELESMDLSLKQKHDLAAVIDSAIHNQVLDLILSKLTQDDKKVFLEKMYLNPHDLTILDFLKEKISGLEEQITREVDILVVELHQDLKQAKHYG